MGVLTKEYTAPADPPAATAVDALTTISESLSVEDDMAAAACGSTDCFTASYVAKKKAKPSESWGIVHFFPHMR